MNPDQMPVNSNRQENIDDRPRLYRLTYEDDDLPTINIVCNLMADAEKVGMEKHPNEEIQSIEFIDVVDVMYLDKE